MQRNRWPVLIVCGVCAVLLLSGCFEVEEWVRVGANGATALTTKLRLGFSKQGQSAGALEISSELGTLGKGVQGVRVQGAKTEEKNGQVIVSVSAEADRLKDFAAFYRKVPPKEGGNKGVPDIGAIFSKGSFYQAKRNGNRIHITRTLQPVTKATPKKKGKDAKMSDDMAQMMMGGVFMRFALTVPGKIVASNAETVDGQTLTWIYPMPFLSKQRTELWVDVEATPETGQALLGQ